MEIFRICPLNITQIQKTKEDKYFKIFNYFYFMCAINLRETVKQSVEKRRGVPLIYNFYISFYIELPQ